MSILAPQISAQLEALLARDPSVRVIAIRSASKQVWPESIAQRGRQFSLRWCDSMLAMREALCDAELAEIAETAGDGAKTGLVLLTPLGTHQIAEDIAARLARGEVFQPEGWPIVRQLFEAKSLDARLRRHAWIAQVLVDGVAQGAYPPVAQGYLDLETVWSVLLERFLGLAGPRPDCGALLRWTMQADADASLRRLPSNALPDVLQWLSESAGVAGKLVAAAIDAGRTGDALALGLVCAVVYAPTGEGQAALGHAAIRLERFVGDTHVGMREGRAWAEAARQLLLAEHAPVLYHAALERADALLHELRVTEFAHLSDVSLLGLTQRLCVFAGALTRHAQDPSDSHLHAVETAANDVLRHRLIACQVQRAEQVQMARRIARWLTHPALPSATATVADMICWQADQGAFVDWARFRLLGGDASLDVSRAYEALRNAVSTRRNVLGRQFALALQGWNAQAGQANAVDAGDGRVVRQEAVLERILAPMAARNQVLLLVIDGLSISIFRELFANIERFGWSEMMPEGMTRPLAGIAALPTVTEVSRASLLCGKLTVGNAALEKTGFASHPGLLPKSKSEAPAKLFHKGELSDASNLSDAVRNAIADGKQRVVGLVYNAVDDHLSGPDQLLQRWNLEDLRLLLPILAEARQARRVLIVSADHGHMLDDGTRQIAGGESARWRVGRDAVDDGEIALGGGRVRTAQGADAVVCLWSESVRYCARYNGYHGGVSTQEVALPLSVFVPIGMDLTDWQPAIPAQPEWWDLPVPNNPQEYADAAATPPAVKPSAKSGARAKTTGRRVAATPGQESLFDMEMAPMPDNPPMEAGPAQAAQDWIGQLLNCPIYATQHALAARVAPSAQLMRKLLAALGERGGKLSRAALAQRLAIPEMRLGGILSGARRILNVDQAQVLLVDDAAATIDLNRILLFQQFCLEPVASNQDGGKR